MAVWIAAMGFVALVGGCRPELTLPTVASVHCDRSEDCPSARGCVAGRCRAPGDACTQGALATLELQADGSSCPLAEGRAGLCLQGECVEPRCGDGFLAEGEACDRGAANGDAPDAPCRSDCLLPRCGDGVVAAAEECEPGVSPQQPCEAFGPEFHPGASAACAAGCLFDRAACPRCGDGEINGEESCDGAAPLGISCLGLGFDAGRVGCNPLSCEAELGECVRWGWSQIETTVREDLNDLAGPADGSFLYAVGDGGVILGYQGDRWRTLASPSEANLERVVVASTSPQLAWAAGSGGTLLRLTGAEAQLVPGPGGDYLALASCGADRLVVASSRAVFEFDGSTWTEPEVASFLDPPSPGSIVDVACVDGEAWVLVSSIPSGAGKIVVRRAGAWLPEGGLSVCDYPQSLDVADGRVAVGCLGGRPARTQAATFTFDPSGPSLQPLQPQLELDSFAAPEVRWASGEVLWLYGSGLLGRLSEQEGWFGEALDLEFDLRAGWSGSGSLSYVVGSGGLMLSSTGYGRRAFAAPPGRLSYDGARGLCVASGGRLVAIGEAGLRGLRATDLSWQELASTPNGEEIEAIDCNPGSEVVCAAGNHGFVGCYDFGDGTLTTLRSAASGGPDVVLHDVWRAPDGTVFAADFVSSAVWGYDGAWTELSVEAPPGNTAQSWILGGRHGDEVYSFDRWNGVSRYTGGTGFELTALSGADWESLVLPASEMWVGPDAEGSTAVVVASIGGRVLVLRNGSVTRHRSGQFVGHSEPVGLWGSRLDDLFLVQKGGDAYRFDGEEWSPVRFAPLDAIWAIAGRAGDSLYVAGSSNGSPTVVQVRYPRPIGER